jgi:hypothetical protein
VIGKVTQIFPLSARKLTRVLAALLLASITWGATAEFTHSHGLRTRSTLTQAQTADSSFTTDESVQSSSSPSGSSRSKSAADCLICQLHQNLSTTLLGHTLAVATVEARSFRFNPDPLLHRADFSRSQRGRAPPTIL